MIRIKGMHKFFNKGHQNEIHVINDVNLDLPEKGMVAIFGKSGCGKTTLLNVIGGLDDFGAGSLLLDGKDIRHNTDDIRNRYVGYIFQNYNLNKQESCYENVADALRLCGIYDEKQIEMRVMAALKNVDMEKYAKRLPDTLSGGQQQRIAIARAIVKNPRIVLADEPTGNLDEANTVMIMDLLKAISKDHLVLLVTHEADLVDYYCDSVIELADGKIANIRSNNSANGYSSKNKNDIYLGELSHDTLQNDGVNVEYYGDAPSEPVKLQIVHHEGKIYIKIHTPKVHLLDEYSEVKLREGVYVEKESHASGNIDMSDLPPVQCSTTGRLFKFISSVKSGYAANFTANKRGKKLLKRCLRMFAAVIVLMSAIFGTAISDILNAKDAFNHNVFYVYTPTPEISQKLNDAIGKSESGIDFLRMLYGYSAGDERISFRVGNFETFSISPLDSGFSTNAVYMDGTMCKNLTLVEGKKDAINDNEMVITTKVADALIEKSTVGYIQKYSDLIGLISDSFYVNGKGVCIAGVVKSDESAVYFSEIALADHVNMYSGLYVQLADDSYALGKGEVVFVTKPDASTPKIGSTIQINGIDLTVKQIATIVDNYDEWLGVNGIEKMNNPIQYCEEIVKKEYPSYALGSEEYEHALEKVIEGHYYEFYDYYYEELDRYLNEYFMLQPYGFEAWLYVVKGFETPKYVFCNTDEYFKAVEYKKIHGTYPSPDALNRKYGELPNLNEEMDRLYKLYDAEFQSTSYPSFDYPYGYLVSKEDYIAFSKRIGKTDQTAGGYTDYATDDTVYIEPRYTLIHSCDPEITEGFLNDTFGEYETSYTYLPMIITPNDQFATIIKDNLESIVSSLVTMGILLGVMSVCMYLIMRSALMSRIKEVGIYRAIGVSKKNLIYRFMVESLVLFTLTVFVGYLCTSAFIAVCIGISPMVSSIFFYPFWMALVILVVLYMLCLFCGILPIALLLRKTPSQILAKYDI